jgi:hypothetical protein
MMAAVVRCYPNDDASFRACVEDLLGQHSERDRYRLATALTEALRAFFPEARVFAQTDLGRRGGAEPLLYAYRDGRVGAAVARARSETTRAPEPRVPAAEAYKIASSSDQPSRRVHPRS